MKTIGKDGILLRLAKDMYPERDDLSSIEVKTLFNDICHKYIQREGIYDLLSWAMIRSSLGEYRGNACRIPASVSRNASGQAMARIAI